MRNTPLAKNRETLLKLLKNELLNFRFHAIPIRGWFGKGFIAVPHLFAQLDAVIFRQNKYGDDYTVQTLEGCGGLHKHQLQELRRRTHLKLPLEERPYLPTKRGWNYGWQWLIPVSEYRTYAALNSMLLLEKSELRKRVGHREPPQEPGPQRLRVMPRKQYWGEQRRRIQGAWK